MSSDVATETGDLIVAREGAAGVIRLNRPKALNALTLEMTREIATALDMFEADPKVALIILEGAGERGLCAGGDIRGLYESAKAKGDLGKIFWREEYIVNARIAKFPKPYVAYMDGFVMGGGVGLAGHASHRIVTEKTRMAMPEVGLGFFPDVGGTWLLSRAPGELGTYFGLTGLTANGADALAAHMADVLIDTVNWPALREALTKLSSGADAALVMTTLKKFVAPEQTGPVTAQGALIDRAFAHDSVEEIVAALEQDGSDFALATIKAMSDKSPRGLKVTLKLLRLARASKSLEECLSREYLAALEVFDSADFVEGVRAAIIDKDRNPTWQPPDLNDVTPEIVARYLAPRDVALTF
ncbi:enoyl-CoA hydratase/isomerase family protein [Tardiphaga sp. OK245]|uniref:enoyl-CoA hydratase/isomerase family protein n=1 Tax=Tardiphaga sp. OK245 TaxID=1855306 RepID=UPI0008A75542|nr:enoyl-CoA hydratase/isomerase family protein [Tardiphaga sp. OK245]SEI06701.1 enoyl-CoA hydratase [Tardiphaga sp. OK245]